jgi:hypothetical protein
MPQNRIDHTKEVERRISAIATGPRDTCSFYQQRDMCLALMKECWYCRYASFALGSDDPDKHGFCKFKSF